MKKSIAWILTTIMMLALLTGCGSKSAKSDTEYVKKNGKLITERDGLGQRVYAGDAERAEEERLGEHAPGQRPGQLDRVLGREALIPADVFRYGLVDADGRLLRHEHEDHDIQNGHRHREAENKALVAGKPVFMFSHHGPSQKVYKFFRSDALKWLQNSV